MLLGPDALDGLLGHDVAGCEEDLLACGLCLASDRMRERGRRLLLIGSGFESMEDFWREATHSCGYALREQRSSRELGLVPAFLGD